MKDGGRRRYPLAVLAAGELDTGPHAVLLAALDRERGTAALLLQRAAAQADQPRRGGRLFVNASFGGAVGRVVVGVAEPEIRVGRAGWRWRRCHQGLS